VFVKMAYANANKDGKGMIVAKWTVWIKAVLATVFVYQVNVIAKLDGKAKIVH